MDLLKTLTIAASGLARAGRMRIISENIANADSTPQRADADPTGVKSLPFAANSTARLRAGTPNVNPLIEMTDMREAQRSYEANINVISDTRRMIQRTIDILKA
ncbi:MAG: flagellar basal body rod C-terminal domain-containing protein [Pseudolabrys sp.]